MLSERHNCRLGLPLLQCIVNKQVEVTVPQSLHVHAYYFSQKARVVRRVRMQSAVILNPVYAMGADVG